MIINWKFVYPKMVIFFLQKNNMEAGSCKFILSEDAFYIAYKAEFM
ncbi:hypothetical protein SAMN05660841_00156 [Sphingobacterium nematocida]|uniref:Uncharacterized protein n=1 Tax=Sphingobacterium nematocida TaxID=1513896 RepID=A0A1T5ATF0_9SPHI|nr:hypothetical protein SAMN05660841_00156 [Sphingobacterium nematocida]